MTTPTDEQIAVAAHKLCEDDGKRLGDPYYMIAWIRARADIREHLRVTAAIEWAVEQSATK